MMWNDNTLFFTIASLLALGVFLYCSLRQPRPIWMAPKKRMLTVENVVICTYLLSGGGAILFSIYMVIKHMLQ